MDICRLSCPTNINQKNFPFNFEHLRINILWLPLSICMDKKFMLAAKIHLVEIFGSIIVSIDLCCASFPWVGDFIFGMLQSFF
jgi:hypothetical protein